MDSKTFNLLHDYQKDLLWDLFHNSGKPFVNHYGRKAWESKYDPKYNQASASPARRVVPDVSTLPSNRWVVPRVPEGSTEEKHQWTKDRDAWLTDRKVKNQVCLVMVNGHAKWVYLFKKTNDAVMFKLTWG